MKSKTNQEVNKNVLGNLLPFVNMQSSFDEPQNCCDDCIYSSENVEYGGREGPDALQQMQTGKTQANYLNSFINLTTYAQHQSDSPCAAFKKSTAKTENTTEVFPGTHKSDGHLLVFSINGIFC